MCKRAAGRYFTSASFAAAQNVEEYKLLTKSVAGSAFI